MSDRGDQLGVERELILQFCVRIAEWANESHLLVLVSSNWEQAVVLEQHNASFRRVQRQSLSLGSVDVLPAKMAVLLLLRRVEITSAMSHQYR